MVRVNRWTAAALIAIFLFVGLLIGGTTIVEAEPAVRTPSSARSLISTLSTGERPAKNANNEYAGNIYAVKFSPDGKQ